MNRLKEIGESLKKMREAKSLSKYKIRASSGMSISTITRMEEGHDFTVSTLIRYYEACGEVPPI